MPITPMEIMRGSILCYEGRVQKVKSIGEYIMFEGWKEWVGGSLINGEPLSVEWLDRFGFVWDKDPTVWSKGKLSIVIKNDQYPKGRVYFNSWAIWEYQPEFVHQLQLLALALTGEHLKVPKLK